MLFLMLLAGTLRYRHEVTAAILDAGNRCIQVIIPSLYLFSILAAFCVRSGVLEILAAPLERFSRNILHMDGSILMVLLFSQTAGYPIGTQLLERLYEKGKLGSIQRDWLLCVCFGCGPAFLLGTVGGVLRLSPLCAMLLMLSVSLPNLLFALLLARRCPFQRDAASECSLTFRAAELTESVEQAAAAMLKICSMILMFSGISGLVKGSGVLGILTQTVSFLGIPKATAEPLLLTFLEISNLTEFLQQGGSLPMAAALLSFGGICVHLQNAAICGGAFPWRKFLCIRMLAAACSYLLCAVTVGCCFGGQLPAVLQIPPHYQAEMTTRGTIPVVCLILMSMLLLRKGDGLRFARKFTKCRGNLSRFH